MFESSVIAKILLIRLIRKRTQRKRSIYIRDIFLNRNVQGESFLVHELRADPHYHFKYFRMDKGNFDHILARIESKLQHNATHARPISSIERLALTLRYLASGNSQISLAMSYRISPASISIIVKETLRAICDEFTNEYLPPPSEEHWLRNETGFLDTWNFPNCCGAIDGKHVRVKAPNATGSLHFNYKGYFSIVLLAIAGPDYRFTAVDIGRAGSESDGGILIRSSIGKRLFEGQFGIPKPKSIMDSQQLLPRVILGDSGFPLKENLMVPFKGDYLSKEIRVYNYRLSRARMVVENAFGVLAARWRIYHTSMDGSLALHKLIVQSTILLHNFLMTKSDYNNVTVDRIENNEVIPGNWREITQSDAGMTGLQRQGSNNYSSDASSVRQKFKEYFNSVGALSWQDKYVSREF